MSLIYRIELPQSKLSCITVPGLCLTHRTWRRNKDGKNEPPKSSVQLSSVFHTILPMTASSLESDSVALISAAPASVATVRISSLYDNNTETDLKLAN